MKRSTAFTIMALTGVTIMVAVLSSGPTDEELAEQEQVRQEQYLQSKADEVVGSLKYIKDNRTNICFAYLWKGSPVNGGPALSTVPCDAIPSELLKAAN